MAKSDYLKVIPQKKAGGRDVRDVIKEQFEFGSFHEQFRTMNWVVLEFYPYSVDLGISRNDTVYATRGEALNAAIQHLINRGYEAKQFDLEGMIDKI